MVWMERTNDNEYEHIACHGQTAWQASHKKGRGNKMEMFLAVNPYFAVIAAIAAAVAGILAFAVRNGSKRNKGTGA